MDALKLKMWQRIATPNGPGTVQEWIQNNGDRMLRVTHRRGDVSEEFWKRHNPYNAPILGMEYTIGEIVAANGAAVEHAGI